MTRPSLILSFFVACLIACEDQGSRYPDFGPLAYSYMADSVYPRIVNDSLIALIHYSGGIGNRQLEIQFRILDATQATLWLHYLGSARDPATGYFTQFIALKIPERVLRSPGITLLAPHGGPYVLR